MRRTHKEIKNLRKKVVEARKEGCTYEELRKKYSLSPSTISKWIKGKDLKRYCVECGETDILKLEEHHPDKINQPNYTITLCSNCHSELHRKQDVHMKKAGNPENRLKQNSLTLLPAYTNTRPLQISPAASHIYHSFTPKQIPLKIDPQVVDKIIRITAYALGGVLISESLSKKDIPLFERVIEGSIGFLILKYIHKSHS